MKKLTGWLLLPLGACTTTSDGTTGVTNTPEKLMRAIYATAVQKDYESVRLHVYPAPAFPGITTQDAVVQVMKENRPRNYTGDFSYSDEALKVLIDRHLEKFSSDVPRSWLKPEQDSGLLDAYLMQKTGGDPTHFRLLDHKGVHILLVRLDGCFKLLFWEGLNHLIWP